MRVALVCLAFAGCNSILGIGDIHSNDGADAPMAPDASVDAAPPSDVNGTAIDTYIDGPGTSTTHAEDLSGYTIAAYVPDGSGGFQIIPGHGTTDGHFTIPAVPAGPYYLLATPPNNGFVYASFYYTTSHAPDLGFQLLGRAGGPQVTQSTPIDVQLTGMTPAIGGAVTCSR